MKHLLAILLFFFVSIAASAQGSVAEWAEQVHQFGSSLPQEKVFIHTDNQCYFIGDTIFFRAYLTRSDTRRPSGLSGVLYVDLLNSDGYLVERQHVKMSSGMGTGNFILDPKTCLYAGYYEIRAYTRWMLNWGLTEYKHSVWSEQWFFNKDMAKSYYNDYEKLYSRVLPVYDKPDVPGEYHRDMTSRPMRRTFASDDTHNRPTLNLFPEGGDLVSGVPCRMAFEAHNGEGRHLRGTLRITASDGSTVAEAQTQNRGRGVVRFTPQAGTKYKCTFQSGDETIKADMPQVKADGVSLECSIIDNRFSVTVTPSGAAKSDALGMTIMNSGMIEKTFDLQSDGMTQAIPLDQLPMGVLDITVYNAEGRVWADRLIFNTAAAKLSDTRITISGADDSAGPYKPITLRLKSNRQAKGIVSVAVDDSATTDNVYDNGSLMTEMLLASEIRGFVEDPGYYFEADDEEHRTALDLLLMVQGWRRFSWQAMAQPKENGFAINQPYERSTPIILGQVNKYRAEEHIDLFGEMAKADAEKHMADNDTDPWADEEESETLTVTSGIEDLQTEVESNQHVWTQDAEMAAERFDEDYGKLKREVRVHAEFSQPGSEPLIGDMDTEGSRFRIEAPTFEGECYFFLAASDTTHWGKKEHNWVQVNRDDVNRRELPEFYVRLDEPFPRFAQPYNFYQTASAERRLSALTKTTGRFDDRQLDEVVVSVRRNGVRSFDKNYPAIDVDALQAFNYAIDAGLCTGQYIGYHRFCNDVARAYIGDMGMDRQYLMQIRLDDKNNSSNISDGAKNAYNDIANLDRVRIYTDYAPRRTGDSRWVGSDQPIVIVDLMRIPHDGKRVTYRDRRMLLTGFAVIEDFYNPDYSRMSLPEKPDMRRTLYWNPALMLDDNGEAEITLYRNSRHGEIIVTVNGFSADGTPLSGEVR